MGGGDVCQCADTLRSHGFPWPHLPCRAEGHRLSWRGRMKGSVLGGRGVFLRSVENLFDEAPNAGEKVGEQSDKDDLEPDDE